MKDDASLADELKSSFLEKDARAAVVAAINERRTGPKDDNSDGDDDYIDKPMARKVSNKTIAKYVNAIVPDVVRTADQQSERRRETMANPRTHISAAVVIPFSQRGVCSALKFSTDRWQKLPRQVLTIDTVEIMSFGLRKDRKVSLRPEI